MAYAPLIFLTIVVVLRSKYHLYICLLMYLNFHFVLLFFLTFVENRDIKARLNTFENHMGATQAAPHGEK